VSSFLEEDASIDSSIDPSSSKKVPLYAKKTHYEFHVINWRLFNIPNENKVGSSLIENNIVLGCVEFYAQIMDILANYPNPKIEIPLHPLQYSLPDCYKNVQQSGNIFGFSSVFAERPNSYQLHIYLCRNTARRHGVPIDQKSAQKTCWI